MNDVTDIPYKVLYLQQCKIAGIPVGMSLYLNIVNEYPEYFPVEAEHHRKWDLIPQEVHNQYNKEYLEAYNKYMSDLPHDGKGIMYFIRNPKEYTEWSKAYNDAIEKAKPHLDAIHKKHYSKYNITLT